MVRCLFCSQFLLFTRWLTWLSRSFMDYTWCLLNMRLSYIFGNLSTVILYGHHHSMANFLCAQFVLQQYDNPLSKKLNDLINEIRRQRCSYLRYASIILVLFFFLFFVSREATQVVVTLISIRMAMVLDVTTCCSSLLPEAKFRQICL